MVKEIHSGYVLKKLLGFSMSNKTITIQEMQKKLFITNRIKMKKAKSSSCLQM